VVLHIPIIPAMSVKQMSNEYTTFPVYLKETEEE